MALVSKYLPDLQVYKPSFDNEFPFPEEESVYRSKLLHKIEASSAKRLDSRPKHRRAAADYLICDLCFGLLDPISNILVNTIISCCKKG